MRGWSAAGAVVSGSIMPSAVLNDFRGKRHAGSVLILSFSRCVWKCGVSV
jgi:hypothetical protein